MKKILTAAVALSILASAGAASAQPYGRFDDRQTDRREQRDDRNDSRFDRRDDRQDNRYERRADRRYQAGRYQAPRGYQSRNWHRGDVLPSSYRGSSYRIDHRAYGLGAPPRGYGYVRVGDDVVLTALATGVIASVVLQMFR